MKHRLVIFIILLAIVGSSKGNTNSNMTEREFAMLDEVNFARTKPAEYAAFIDEYLSASMAGASEKNVAKELHKILITMKPLNPLEFSPFLYKYAVLHGQWMSDNNEFEHSDFNFDYGENLISGVENVRHAVIDLLIDDGIPSRGHRINILHPQYKHFAVHEVPKTIDMADYTFIQMFSLNKIPSKENP